MKQNSKEEKKGITTGRRESSSTATEILSLLLTLIAFVYKPTPHCPLCLCAFNLR
jgi:hypothetical protein